ncbi:Hypothetical protein ERGA_CDS_02510 [Ehrlichia ruminantium str. Gardel]|uniref:Cpg1 family polymorphic protein n=1 Tax=Ehrlichia ruminantium TaxID=779 RepID=UPI00004C775B|nr:hypothetical protein [Ehrlichia ruminantium]CAI27703.1 Hypothetical protein ERGA_CDS_02510 [Ehrlichia ruminantium str. Gardel]
MRKIKLTNTQTTLLGSINLLIATHTPKPRPFLRNCLSYISHNLDTMFFGKQDTVHEACTIVTEELRNYIIMNSLSLEDYSAVLESVDQEVRNKIGHKSLLTNLCLQLEKKISGETKENYRKATEAFGDTEEIFSHLTATNSFNPGALGNYTDFIYDHINQNNSMELYQEAKLVLSITCLLTPQSTLLRGLARAVINTVNYNSCTVNSLESEQFIEFCTAASLNITASTRSLREHTIRNISRDFAGDHPIINWFLNTSNNFNANRSGAVLYASIGAALAIFVTRFHADSVIDDIIKRVNDTQNLTICRNSTLYEKSISEGNNNTSTNGNNTIVYVSDHVSRYFPNNEGWFNGMVEWIPCVLRMTLLLFVLPRAFLSPVKKRYILQRYKLIENTTQQQTAHNSLVMSMAWRWICVASMQPGKVVTSKMNDNFFKWSVLRFVLPLTFVEEPLKLESVACSSNRLSYRNTSSQKFHTPISIIYICCATSLILEYTSTSVSLVSLPVSHALTIFTKLTRPVALIIPLVLNRNRIQFSPNIRTVVLASLVRLGATGAFLPIFDLARGKLQWESITSAFLQLASVYSDRTVGHVIHKINTVEIHLAVINPIILSTIQGHGSSITLLLPIIEQGQNRQKYETSIAEASALLETQVDLIIQQQQRRSSPSIVEITDEEAERIIREQERTRPTAQQRRSDLNASSGEVSIEFIQEEGNHQCKVVKFTDKCKHKPKKHRKHKDLPPSNSNENVALLSLTQYSSSSFFKKDDISTTNTTQTTVSTAQDRTPSSNVCAPTVYQNLRITELTLRRHSI